MGSSSTRSRARGFRNTVAAAAAATLVIGASLGASTAAFAAPEEGVISDATFTWGVSGEAGGGAFFGGCNFLSAGTAADTGSSRVWTEGEYAASSTNVAIVKPDATGALVPATWATKCKTPTGTNASAASNTSLTRNAVVVSNGSGSVAADGSTSVAWSGSFTVVFYGGMTYWTASDPELTLDADGNGSLTATASGYGASMENPELWVELEPATITLANFTSGVADNAGFTGTPDYLGVAVTSSTTEQVREGAVWGSFPQDFIDYQILTGQSSYWYSSGGSRDAAKPASPFSASWTRTAAPAPADDELELGVTVPEVITDPTGSFGWEFESTSAVSLGTATAAGSTFSAAGALNPITVTDTRAGGQAAYGWSISGQVSEFADGAATFGADYLGWTPTVSAASAGVTAGSPVTSSVSGGSGLADSATLASSTAAASATINASLLLVIPGTTPAGDYTATLTVTALG